MSFLQATSEENPLSSALEQIASIDREIDSVEITVKEMKKRRDALASVAVEEMTTGRLDGVRVAGRSWRVEWEHRVSATGEHQVFKFVFGHSRSPLLNVRLRLVPRLQTAALAGFTGVSWRFAGLRFCNNLSSFCCPAAALAPLYRACTEI